MIDSLIPSKTRIKLLVKFFLNPDVTSYLRGLAEFFLAIPAMFGGSLIKLLKFHHFASGELGILLIGMIVAFAVSIFAIRFLMQYIKQHDFKAFGWYRIVLGIIVLGFFLIAG